MQPAHEVTQLLQAWRGGDADALSKLIPVVYDELHRLAHCYMARERAQHSLQTTALVHEAYLQLVEAQSVDWKNRIHFFALSASLMRRILVAFARTRGCRRRGGGIQRIEFDDQAIVPPEPGDDLVALDDALRALAVVNARQAKVVELRFFGGLTEQETAEFLKISTDTVMRDWKKAKLWLWDQLRHGDANES